MKQFSVEDFVNFEVMLSVTAMYSLVYVAVFPMVAYGGQVTAMLFSELFLVSPTVLGGALCTL